MIKRSATFMIALCVRTFCIVVIGLGLLLLLGRALLPMAADLKLQAEANLSYMLKADVEIEALSGRFNGFNPVLVVEGVTINPHNHAQNSRLDSSVFVQSMSLELDSYASARQAHVIIKSLQVTGVELFIQQDEQLKWSLSGLAVDENQQQDWTAVLRLLELQQHISFQQTRIHIRPFGREGLSLDLDYAEFDSIDSVIQVQAMANKGFEQTVELRLELFNAGSAELDDFSKMRLQAYVEGQGLRVESWLDFALGREQTETHKVGLETELASKLWASWDGQLWRLQGRIDVPSLSLGDASAALLSDLSTNVGGQLQPGKDWQLWFDELQFDFAQQRWPSSSFSLSQSLLADSDKRLQAYVSEVDLAKLSRLLAPSMPEKQKRLLQTLNPRGLVQGLSLSLEPETQHFELSAALQDVGVDAWAGAPAAQGVSGFIEAGPEFGSLKLDSSNFSLDLPKLFRRSWDFKRSQGLLHWQLDDEGVELSMRNMSLSAEEGEVNAQLRLSIPASGHPINIALLAGVHEGQLRYADKYIPARMPQFSQPLLNWLDSALGDADVPQGAYMMNGVLTGNDEPHDLSFGLHIDVEDASIDYASAWPKAEDVTARVLVDNRNVWVEADAGRLWDASLQSLSFQALEPEAGQAMHLVVKARALSNATTAKRVLLETPIQQALGKAVETWQISGDIPFELSLDIPLDGPEGLATSYAVGLELKDNDFAIPNAKLDLSKINGRLNYSSAKGLHARNVRAQMMQGPVTIQIDPPRSKQELLRVRADGRAPVSVLKDEFKIPYLDMARGVLPYRANFLLSRDEEAGSRYRLDLRSNLQGVTLALPEPLAKDDNEQGEFRLSLTGRSQAPQWLRLSLNYADSVDANLLLQDSRLFGANVLFGPGLAKPRMDSGVNFSGRLPALEAQPWLAWLQGLAKYQQSAADDGASDSLARAYRLNFTELRLDALNIGPLSFPDVRIDGEMSPQQWSFEVDSTKLAGKVVMPWGHGLPYKVNLQRLYLPAAPSSKAGATTKAEPLRVEDLAVQDPWQDFDPARIPAMDVSIQDLRRGEGHLGQISTRLRPHAYGLHLLNVEQQLENLRVFGALSWNYQHGLHHTYYTGSVVGDDIRKLLHGANLPEIASSEKVNFKAKLDWLGSPLGFSPLRLSGSLQGGLHDGVLVEAKGAAQLLKVFGILNFRALTRRLSLDFSDLYSSGLVFDTARVDLRFDRGIVSTPRALKIKGPSSDFQYLGAIDLHRDQIGAELRVVLPLTSNLPILGLLLGNPIIGGGLLLFDQLLGDKVGRLGSVRYIISGAADDPNIEVDRLFSGELK